MKFPEASITRRIGVMKMKNKRLRAFTVLAAFLAIAALVSTYGEQAIISAFNTGIQLPAQSYEAELEPGQYITICDKNGKELDRTSRQVYVGDELITEDNLHYRVEKVKGHVATAVFLGKENITWDENSNKSDTPVYAGGRTAAAAQQQTKNNLIAVYHTHSDESYVPTDGTDSIPGDGGIFKVGNVFSEKLRALGIDAVHDLRSHEPHDANAYLRSRRTATKLLSKDPIAIIDVHRDGVPDPDFYRDEVSNMPVSKVRLVVGQQNQNMQANYDFAKRLKGYMDQKYPGLVKGIFLGKGNYNQDLSPRSILVEAGTHTITRQRAQKGIALFAEALPAVLGVTAPTPSARQPFAGTSGDTAATLFVIVALIVGAAIYLVISTGSVEAAVQKLRQFVTVEWANFLGKRKNKK